MTVFSKRTGFRNKISGTLLLYCGLAFETSEDQFEPLQTFRGTETIFRESRDSVPRTLVPPNRRLLAYQRFHDPRPPTVWHGVSLTTFRRFRAAGMWHGTLTTTVGPLHARTRGTQHRKPGFRRSVPQAVGGSRGTTDSPSPKSPQKSL